MSFSTVVLRDSTGAEAVILPHFGFNCFQYRPVVAGQPVDALWAHENFRSGNERPSGSGIPILFPFAGRIRGTSFQYNGVTYPLTEGDRNGNAIHGFVMGRAWRIVEEGESFVVGEFHGAVDAPEVLAHWPSDFRLNVRYELRDGALHTEFVVRNPGDRVLPFGLASHAYFRTKLGPVGDGSRSIVKVPGSQGWELEGLLPTGKKYDALRRVPLALGMAYEDCQLDNVLGELESKGGVVTTTVYDPQNGRTLTQTFDSKFRYCVVYTPPHRHAVCMEPYTTLPNSFELAARREETGLLELKPGEEFSARTMVRID